MAVSGVTRCTAHSFNVFFSEESICHSCKKVVPFPCTAVSFDMNKGWTCLSTETLAHADQALQVKSG